MTERTGAVGSRQRPRGSPVPGSSRASGAPESSALTPASIPTTPRGFPWRSHPSSVRNRRTRHSRYDPSGGRPSFFTQKAFAQIRKNLSRAPFPPNLAPSPNTTAYPFTKGDTLFSPHVVGENPAVAHDDDDTNAYQFPCFRKKSPFHRETSAEPARCRWRRGDSPPARDTGAPRFRDVRIRPSRRPPSGRREKSSG
jgi:hypothetical protein